jgi:hypothetical protein
VGLNFNIQTITQNINQTFFAKYKKNDSINFVRWVGKKAGQHSPENFRDARGSIFLP